MRPEYFRCFIMPFNSIQDRVGSFFSEGYYHKAFNYLDKVVNNPEDKTDLLLLKAQYNNVKSRKGRGLLSTEDEKREI
ncbi:MAG: hypothetical protein AAFV80_22935, partial [Bacteroidota bacterium]